MQENNDNWRQMFHMAEDFKQAKHGIYEDIQENNERYTGHQYLAAGGMKEIHSVDDKNTGRKVALAYLKNHDNVKTKENFLREARITAFLQHPNIMPVYDISIDDEGKPYFTM